jgi:transposase
MQKGVFLSALVRGLYEVFVRASALFAWVWDREWAKEGVRIDWEKLLPPKGFRVLPRRWVVERTFSWLGQNRRLSKDYERLCETSEAFIYVAMIRLMVRHLARR